MNRYTERPPAEDHEARMAWDWFSGEHSDKAITVLQKVQGPPRWTCHMEQTCGTTSYDAIKVADLASRVGGRKR